jgi:hypothetical protein
VGLTRTELVEFDFNQIIVKPAPANQYRLLLSKYHYLANAGRGGLAYGAYLGELLIAAAVFSPMVRQNITLPEGTAATDVRELSRLCIHPNYSKPNMASWFVSRCLGLLPAQYRTIISYCDTTFNHNGAVYRACNFVQDREVPADYWYVSSGDWIMHKKTLYDHAVRLGLTEHEYAELNGYVKIYGKKKLRFVYKR